MTKINFLDSNVCVYSFDESKPSKQQIAFDLLGTNAFISSQVVIETYNACKRKLKLPEIICEKTILALTEICRIVSINESTIIKAIELKNKYQFSFLYAVIVASALNANCTTLYTEDMQHNQVIENTLTICNPFV